MARLSFRDRFLTPPVARAILSPLGMVLFGVGAAGGILVGAPLIIAAAAGVGAWGAQVLAAVPRGEQTERIEPFALSDPWRSYVVDAQVSKKRFDKVVAGMRKGPTRERLAAMDDRLEQGLDESWRIAKRGHDITQAIRGLNTSAAEKQLAEIAAGAAAARQPTESESLVIDALQSQIDAAHRLSATAAAARDKLRVLDARFAELVARAIEVSVGTGDSNMLGDDVDGLVTELEALRSAIEETADADGRAAAVPLPQPLHTENVPVTDLGAAQQTSERTGPPDLPTSRPQTSPPSP